MVRNCFDDQTEILTEQRGWQLFRNLMPDDKVAQLRDGNLEFVLPTMHYAAPYCGEMIGFEGEGIDMLVTPDHRMWVSERHTRQKIWADYGLRKASDIYGRQTFRVKRDAVWIGAATKHTEEFFEWLGFWFAEGCAGQYFERHIRRRQCTTTQHKPEGIVYVEDLHRRSGLAYTVTDRPGGKTFRIRNAGNEALIDDLAGCGKALNKFMRPWMKAAPPGHLAAFIRGFVAGDGWKSGGSTFACTSSPQLADDLQEIALKAGLMANITVDPIVHREGSFKANAPRNVVTFVTPKKYAPVLSHAVLSEWTYYIPKSLGLRPRLPEADMLMSSRPAGSASPPGICHGSAWPGWSARSAEASSPSSPPSSIAPTSEPASESAMSFDPSGGWSTLPFGSCTRRLISSTSLGCQ